MALWLGLIQNNMEMARMSTLTSFEKITTLMTQWPRRDFQSWRIAVQLTPRPWRGIGSPAVVVSSCYTNDCWRPGVTHYTIFHQEKPLNGSVDISVVENREWLGRSSLSQPVQKENSNRSSNRTFEEFIRWDRQPQIKDRFSSNPVPLDGKFQNSSATGKSG